jgi:hypothetical protein
MKGRLENSQGVVSPSEFVRLLPLNLVFFLNFVIGTGKWGNVGELLELCRVGGDGQGEQDDDDDDKRSNGGVDDVTDDDERASDDVTDDSDDTDDSETDDEHVNGSQKQGGEKEKKGDGERRNEDNGEGKMLFQYWKMHVLN